MKITDKLLKNLMKIMKINGFHVIVEGESPVTYNLEGTFYFDNEKDLEEFRDRFKSLINDHTGGTVTVETFDEQAMRLARDQYNK